MKLTNEQKLIYNKGVKDACRELLKYDGVIQSACWRKYVSEDIKKNISYKIHVTMYNKLTR